MKVNRKKCIVHTSLVLAVIGIIGGILFWVNWKWAALYWAVFAVPWLAAILTFIENIVETRGITEVGIEFLGD